MEFQKIIIDNNPRGEYDGVIYFWCNGDICEYTAHTIGSNANVTELITVEPINVANNLTSYMGCKNFATYITSFYTGEPPHYKTFCKMANKCKSVEECEQAFYNYLQNELETVIKTVDATKPIKPILTAWLNEYLISVELKGMANFFMNL